MNTTGFSNSAVGVDALLNNTTGSRNSAVGVDALRANTTGTFNSAAGINALRANTTGNYSSAFGSYALLANTTGDSNSALGTNALRDNTSGYRNAAVGTNSLYANTTGRNNSAFGYRALRANTTGGSNTAVGQGALESNTTGSFNVAIGVSAGGSLTSGGDNIYIAHNGLGAESQTMRIGALQNRVFIAGIRGRTTGNANAVPVLIDSAGQLGTVSSSRSVKQEIRDMGDATERLLDLRPVTFRYKQHQTLPRDGEMPPEYGLIAEEVAEVFPDLVVYDEEGQPETVKYHQMASMLLNEMQKQQRQIQEQRSEIVDLLVVRDQVAGLRAELDALKQGRQLADSGGWKALLRPTGLVR